MKRTALSVCLLLAGFSVMAQSWKSSQHISGINGLQVSHGIDVYLSQGNRESLSIEAKGFDKDEVKVETRNGVLRLSTDRSWGFNWGRDRYVKVYLTFKQLNNIRTSGGADLFSEGTLSFDNLSIDASGGSDVKLDLKADRLVVDISGGADAKLRGSAKVLTAESSGGADLDARQLTSEICMVSASGGSDAYVQATKEIKMRASGGSDIYYYGSPKVISKSESGGGDITRRD